MQHGIETIYETDTININFRINIYYQDQKMSDSKVSTNKDYSLTDILFIRIFVKIHDNNIK